MRGRLSGLLLALLAGPAPGQDSALAELDRAGRSIAATRCARPQEAKTSQVAGGRDEMQSIDCRTFRVALYVTRSEGAQRESPMALVVLAGGPALPSGLAVGALPADVQARLGPPSRQRGASFSYLLDPSRPAGDAITFEVEDGRVRAVSWSWQID